MVQGLMETYQGLPSCVRSKVQPEEEGCWHARTDVLHLGMVGRLWVLEALGSGSNPVVL